MQFMRITGATCASPTSTNVWITKEPPNYSSEYAMHDIPRE